MSPRSIFIGYDPREQAAYAVAKNSIRNNLQRQMVDIYPIILDEMVKEGLYWRPTETKNGRLWDTISEAPMSTEFANSRFLMLELARRRLICTTIGRKIGWTMFMDCDMLVRGDISSLFDYVEEQSDIHPKLAAFCVKHIYDPPSSLKMDNQEQTRYSCKNWSSVMLLNGDHSANKKLTLDLINTRPGRELHQFCWLEMDQIGELDPKWNWLVGHSSYNIEPKIVHFTEGGPWFPEYRNVPYADEWMAQLLYE